MLLLFMHGPCICIHVKGAGTCNAMLNHACYNLQSLVKQPFHIEPAGVSMAFFVEAAVLATAWANQPELRELGAKQSLCIIRGKKLARGHANSCALHACIMTVWTLHVCVTKCSGDVARNSDAVGLAVKHLGMRPSQAMLEQAVYQFLSLCVPRGIEICSLLSSDIMHDSMILKGYVLPCKCTLNEPKVLSTKCNHV